MSGSNVTTTRTRTWVTAPALSFRQAALALVVAYAVCLAPVLLAQNPPLHDYMFHIARIYILTHWQMSSALQAHYVVGSFILPNIAFDVIAVLLAHIMPLELAGRVFIALTLALQLSGCMALYRTLQGRYGLWPLAAGLFLYNWIFLFGFLNYLFGVGILLWATAIWINLAVRSSMGAKLLWGTAFSLALFFSHLIACGLFAVIVAGYEIQRAVPMLRHQRVQALRNLLVGASIFVAPIGLFFASSTAAEAGNKTSHSLVNLLRTPPIFVRALLSGDYLIDLVSVGTVVACLGILVGRGRLIVARPMVLPVILLVLCFLAMPHELFGGWGADTRIPLVIVFVLIACVRPVLRDRRWGAVFVAVLGGALLLQSALRSYDWLSYDAVIGEFRTAFRTLPANSVLLIASETDVPSFQDIDLRLWQPPLPHVASLAVLEGRDIFVPDTFAHPGQQPITVTAPYGAIYHYQINKPFEVTTTEALQGFIGHAQQLLADAGSTGPAYVLLLYPRQFNLALPAHTAVVASTSRALLLAVERPASP